MEDIMAQKYEPVKDKTYKENERILAAICISIIVFLACSILWMILDIDILIGVALFALLCIGAMFVLILLRRKKGIYLIEEDEMEAFNKEADEKQRAKQERQQKIDNYKDNKKKKRKTPTRLK